MTLIEVLVVLVVLALLATMTYYNFVGFMKRAQLEGSVEGIVTLLRRARTDALKQRVTTVVQFGLDSGEIVAFADVHDASASCFEESNLKLDPPCKPGQPVYATDHLIDTFTLDPRSWGGVVFWGPTDPAPRGLASLVGLTNRAFAVPDYESQVLVFEPDGIVRDVGAIRIADASGLNYFEVAITAQSGLVETRKWLNADDVPPPWPAPAFYARTIVARGSGSDEIRWVWY